MADRKEDIPWIIEEHTKVKHALLRSYVSVWMKILFAHQGRMGFPKTLIYIDGFSGPGLYWKDATMKEKDLGSPLIVANMANDAIKWDSTRKFHIFCTDTDERCVNYLAPLLAIHNKYYQSWKSMHGEFEQIVPELVNNIKQMNANNQPIFCFIDPFGYSGFSMSVLKQLLEFPMAELFINFMYYDINRFLVESHSQSTLTSLFAGDEYLGASNLTADKKISFLLKLYCDKLRTVGRARFVLPFRVNTPGQGERVRYFLVHASKNIKALREMKNAMAKQSAQPFRFEAIGLGPDRVLDLFEPPDEVKLAKTIHEYLCGMQTDYLLYETIEDWAYEFTVGISKNIKQALKHLENSYGLKIERLAKQKSNTVTEGAKIFKPGRTFDE